MEWPGCELGALEGEHLPLPEPGRVPVVPQPSAALLEDAARPVAAKLLRGFKVHALAPTVTSEAHGLGRSEALEALAALLGLELADGSSNALNPDDAEALLAKVEHVMRLPAERHEDGRLSVRTLPLPEQPWKMLDQQGIDVGQVESRVLPACGAPGPQRPLCQPVHRPIRSRLKVAACWRRRQHQRCTPCNASSYTSGAPAWTVSADCNWSDGPRPQRPPQSCKPAAHPLTSARVVRAAHCMQSHTETSAP
mmetsp:Transcript_63516/g.191766  ORF Transcript_63516/g.191766 Transcript_63516/m.191766 type:complete len:252 (-) Transcript_63516:9-764(-)